MRISELFESVVSRRGNKLQVGSLELQLYPDHIFYVVGGGKDADLSIYKDGAFKPSRTNEIYLKDAASHGVPQAFINLFAKFFATQDIDVVSNGLEELFSKHVKKESGPASTALCNKAKKGINIGASQKSSCISQGKLPHSGNKSHKIGNKRVKVGGKKIKGKAHGGPLPDYS